MELRGASIILKTPVFTYDLNLHEVPGDFAHVDRYIEFLINKTPKSIEDQVKILGEMGFFYRIQQLLDESEAVLTNAISLIEDHNLGIHLLIQQKIRLANTLQWKKDFNKSNLMFDELIKTCEANNKARVYLDFVYQHSGKNYFDQGKYELALENFDNALKLRKRKQSPVDQLESTIQAIQIVKNKLKEFT